MPQSHADVIVWKLLKGTTTDEGYRPPQCDVVSMYLDQINEPFTLTEVGHCHVPGCCRTDGHCRNPLSL